MLIEHFSTKGEVTGLMHYVDKFFSFVTTLLLLLGDLISYIM